MIVRLFRDKIHHLLIDTTTFIIFLDLSLSFDDFMLSSDRIYLFLDSANRRKLAHRLRDKSTGSIGAHMLPERIDNCTDNCTFCSLFSLFLYFYKVAKLNLYIALIAQNYPSHFRSSDGPLMES
jgi:hypothetical protein